MVVGGGGDGGLGLWVEILERERERAKKSKCYIIGRIYNLQILLNELILLSGNPLLALSMACRAE